MRRPRTIRTVCLSACLCLLLAGILAALCSGDATQPTASGQQGGTYTYPLTAEPAGIEPASVSDEDGMQVAHQVFQGLTRYVPQEDGSLLAEPALAQNWSVNGTATVFTFELRHDVRFQPPVGRRVTAADVARSWDRVTDALHPAPLAHVLAPIRGLDDRGRQTDQRAGLTGVEVLGRFTLRVTLRYPFAEFPQVLGHPVAAIVPVDYIEQIGERTFARRPVGSGPYRVVRWRPGTQIDLMRWSAYWNRRERSLMDRIVLPIIHDPAERWRRFAAGELDITDVPPGWRPDAETRRREKTGQWLVQTWPRLSVRLAAVVMTDDSANQWVNETDTAQRRAIALATDGDAVVATMGIAPQTGTGLVAPGAPGFRDGQSPYRFDPATALELLRTYGLPQAIRYDAGDAQAGAREAAALVAMWRRAGMAAYGTPSRGTPARDDVLLHGLTWTADYPSMDAFLFPLFHAGGGDARHYRSRMVDGLLEQARATVDDTQRHNFYAQAEKTLLTDVAYLPLYFVRDLRVSATRVAGQDVDPMGFVDMWTISSRRTPSARANLSDAP